MNLPISAFPNPTENIGQSCDLDFYENPVNEEHDCKIGDDEIVLKDNAQVQIMGHKFSFFGVTIQGRISMS